jgi:hypothetical protein
MNAKCQCGLIRFTTPSATPLAVYICHCTECRTQSASAFGTSVIFPRFDLLGEYTKDNTKDEPWHVKVHKTVWGDDSLGKDTIGTKIHQKVWGSTPAPTNDEIGVFTRTTDSGALMTCYFCKRCGTRLVHNTAVREGEGGEYVDKATSSVKGGCIEGLGREVWDGATHIWCKSAVVPIPEGLEEGVRRFEGEPAK